MFSTDQKNSNRVQIRRTKPAKKVKSTKREWTSEEDNILKKWVEKNGTKRWTHVTKKFKGREAKQCRERWFSRLSPDIKRDAWSEEEYHKLIQAHKKLGCKWSKLAKLLPGRSDAVIKNLWNGTKRRQHTRRTKGKDENTLASLRNILENYIWSITEDSNKLIKGKSIAATSNSESDDYEDDTDDDDDDGKCSGNGMMNIDLNARIETTMPLVDASTTSVYVPKHASVPSSYTWRSDVDYTEFYKDVDKMWKKIQGDDF